jgi:hypothetical protein
MWKFLVLLNCHYPRKPTVKTFKTRGLVFMQTREHPLSDET